jgi:hypothetical protein
MHLSALQQTEYTGSNQPHPLTFLEYHKGGTEINNNNNNNREITNKCQAILQCAT